MSYDDYRVGEIDFWGSLTCFRIIALLRELAWSGQMTFKYHDSTDLDDETCEIRKTVRKLCNKFQVDLEALVNHHTLGEQMISD